MVPSCSLCCTTRTAAGSFRKSRNRGEWVVTRNWTRPRALRRWSTKEDRAVVEEAKCVEHRALSRCVGANEQVEIAEFEAHITQAAVMFRGEFQELHSVRLPFNVLTRLDSFRNRWNRRGVEGRPGPRPRPLHRSASTEADADPAVFHDDRNVAAAVVQIHHASKAVLVFEHVDVLKGDVSVRVVRTGTRGVVSVVLPEDQYLVRHGSSFPRKPRSFRPGNGSVAH